jgi:hypothetical protein
LDDRIDRIAELDSVVGTRRVDLAGRLKGQYEGERREEGDTRWKSRRGGWRKEDGWRRKKKKGGRREGEGKKRGIREEVQRSEAQ